MEKLVLGQRENSYVKVICLGFTIFCGLKVTSQAESKKRALPVISIIFMLSLSFFPKFLTFFFFNLLTWNSASRHGTLSSYPDITWKSLTWSLLNQQPCLFLLQYCFEAPELIIKPRNLLTQKGDASLSFTVPVLVTSLRLSITLDPSHKC